MASRATKVQKGGIYEYWGNHPAGSHSCVRACHSVYLIVTLSTQCDEVLFHIITGMAPELEVVYLQVRHTRLDIFLDVPVRW